MNDAVLVGGLERARDLCADDQGVGDGQRSACHSLGEGVAIDELEHKSDCGSSARVPRARRIDTVDRSDVRMIQRREGLGFTNEAIAGGSVECQFRGQNLDRDPRPSRVSRASNTSPMPPAPSGPTMS